MQIIETAMRRSRTVIMTLAVIFIAGVVTYVTVPKEAEPDLKRVFSYQTTPHATREQGFNGDMLVGKLKPVYVSCDQRLSDQYKAPAVRNVPRQPFDGGAVPLTGVARAYRHPGSNGNPFARTLADNGI